MGSSDEKFSKNFDNKDSAIKVSDSDSNPIFSIPKTGYSFAVSPDSSKVALSSEIKAPSHPHPGTYKVVLVDSISGETLSIFSTDSHSQSAPDLIFLSDNHLVVGERPYPVVLSERPIKGIKTKLILYDIESCKKLDSVEIDCFLLDCAVSVKTQSIFVIGSFHYIHIQIKKNRFSATGGSFLAGSTSIPTPQIDSAGEIYASFDSMDLNKILGSQYTKIYAAPDSINALCLHPKGMISIGGGYSDYSGDSSLSILDLNTGDAKIIPWERMQIQKILPAKENSLLIEDRDNNHLYDIDKELFVWSKEKERPYFNLLDVAHNKGWVFYRFQRSITKVDIETGKELFIIPVEYKLFIGKTYWSEKSELFYFTRIDDDEKMTTLECYKTTPKGQKISSKITSPTVTLKKKNNQRICKECGCSDFEYDDYWNEYTCDNCGRISK